MTESGDTSGKESSGDNLPDLSSLLNEGAFGPSWASGKPKVQSYQDHKGPEDDGDRSRKGSGKPKDRRTVGKPRGDRPPGRGRPGYKQHGGQREQHKPYRPDFEIQLQPHPSAFAALMKAMRDSCRTFELFELSRLFLSKSERFVAKVHPKDSPRKDAGDASSATASETSPFFVSMPDGIGFESEKEAIDHVLGNHLGEFFNIEEVEKDPPKGTFNVVNRCSVTGTLLAPPNYHRYRDVVQEHYASKIHGMSKERFESKIETLRDEEAVNQWVESMKKGLIYKAKDESQEFQHMEEARRYILMKHKDKVVRPADMVRIEGKDLAKLPQNRIRRSIEAVLEKQIRVPLDFSNHLRGRLRRANFSIYKRGGKGGITYACAVKRQYRTPDTSFSDSIQALVEFIENNPDITAQQILKPSAGESVQVKVPQEAEAEAQARGTEDVQESGVQDGNQAEDASHAPIQDALEVQGSQAVESPQPGPGTGEEVSSDAQPSQPPKDEGKASSPLQEEGEEKKFVGEIPDSDTLAQDLRWLIQYGYVTEYGDGKLYAPSVRTNQPEQSAQVSEEERDGGEVTSSTPAPDDPNQEGEQPLPGANVQPDVETQEELSDEPSLEDGAKVPEPAGEPGEVSQPAQTEEMEPEESGGTITPEAEDGADKQEEGTKGQPAGED